MWLCDSISSLFPYRSPYKYPYSHMTGRSHFFQSQATCCSTGIARQDFQLPISCCSSSFTHIFFFFNPSLYPFGMKKKVSKETKWVVSTWAEFLKEKVASAQGCWKVTEELLQFFLQHHTSHKPLLYWKAEWKKKKVTSYYFYYRYVS